MKWVLHSCNQLILIQNHFGCSALFDMFIFHNSGKKRLKRNEKMYDIFWCSRQTDKIDQSECESKARIKNWLLWLWPRHCMRNKLSCWNTNFGVIDPHFLVESFNLEQPNISCFVRIVDISIQRNIWNDSKSENSLFYE